MANGNENILNQFLQLLQSGATSIGGQAVSGQGNRLRNLQQILDIGEEFPELAVPFSGPTPRQLQKKGLADLRSPAEIKQTRALLGQIESQLAPRRVRKGAGETPVKTIKQRQAARQEAARKDPLDSIPKELRGLVRKELQKTRVESLTEGLLAARSGEFEELRKGVSEAEKPESTPFGETFFGEKFLGILERLGLTQQQTPSTGEESSLVPPIGQRPSLVPPIGQEDQINEALSQGFAPEAVQDTLAQEGQRIKVRSPKGKIGSIPASQLEQALREGFVIAGGLS